MLEKNLYLHYEGLKDRDLKIIDVIKKSIKINVLKYVNIYRVFDEYYFYYHWPLFDLHRDLLRLWIRQLKHSFLL